MSTKNDFITAIQNLVPGDDLPLGEVEQGIALNKAIKDHSKHNPLIKVQKIAGNGGFNYSITATSPILTYWADGFSSIKKIEYPVDDTDQSAEYLEEDEYEIFTKEDGDYLRFLEDEPAITEYFRVHYTALHTCTVTACTVKGYDEEAVQMLAASIFCDMLATAYAQDSDSTISADSVDHKGKAERYATRAKVYRKAYFNHLGIEEGQVQAACITTDWDQEGSWQSDRLNPSFGKKAR